MTAVDKMAEDAFVSLSGKESAVYRRLLVPLFLVLSTVGSLRAEEANVAAAREILNKHQDAVIWVSAIMKSQMTGMGIAFGHGQEEKVRALGTVIDPSGLTVVSLTMLNPMGMFQDLFSSAGDDEGQMDFKASFSDIKMRLADGTEVPAKLVLKDPDLDMAFLVPEEGEGETSPKFVSLDLKESSEAGVLDELVLIGRLGSALDRRPSVGLARVAAVVTKPRTFYVVEVPEHQGLGTPVFTQDGKVLGITLMRKGPALEGGLNAMMSGAIATVIVPAGDVLEIAAQALKSGAEEE